MHVLSVLEPEVLCSDCMAVLRFTGVIFIMELLYFGHLTFDLT